MDARKHIREEERLNQALNGNLQEFVEYFYKVLKSYNLDSMPGAAFDCCKYALEEIHLREFNLPEYKFQHQKGEQTNEMPRV